MPLEWHFLRPGWLLMLLPLALLAWRLARVKGQGNAWRDQVDPHLLSHLLVDTGGRRRKWAAWLLALGWLMLVVALAGPTWQRLPQPGFQLQQYRVILLDLSPSMNAADQPPSRLTHARFKVLDLLRASDEGQVALIAYGPEPFVVSPLTSDVDTIAGQVPQLETDLLPVPGERRTGMALDEALDLLQQAAAPQGDVILITDALSSPGSAVAAAQRLSDAGYRLSVLGVGTPSGAPIPLPGGGFIRDANGAAILAPLEEEPLRMLATAGGGTYIRANSGQQDLEALLTRSSNSPILPGSSEEEAITDQWREEGPWLLLALLPLAALAFRRGWLWPLTIVVVVLPVPPSHAFTWEDLWLRPDQQAKQAFDEGRPAEAAEKFASPDWQAAARYQAGQYKESLDDLQGLSGVEADYNRGNALARLWRLEEALAAYEQALASDPDHADARHNRDLVKRLLEQPQNQEPPPMDASMSMQSQGDTEEGDADQQDSESGESQQAAQSGEQTEQGQESGEGQQAGQTPEPGEEGAAGEETPADAQAGGQEDSTQQQASGGEEETRQQEDSDQGDSMEQAQSEGQQGRDRQPAEGQSGTYQPGTPGASDLLAGSTDATGTLAEFARNDPEGSQVMEQMLRSVEDDPAGLLRQRFLLQHLRRSGQLPQADPRGGLR